MRLTSSIDKALTESQTGLVGLLLAMCEKYRDGAVDAWLTVMGEGIMEYNRGELRETLCEIYLNGCIPASQRNPKEIAEELVNWVDTDQDEDEVMQSIINMFWGENVIGHKLVSLTTKSKQRKFEADLRVLWPKFMGQAQ